MIWVPFVLYLIFVFYILHFHFHFSVFKSHCVWSCCNSTFVTFLMVRRLTLKLVRVRRDISVNGSSGWKSAEAFFFGARAKRATAMGLK